MRNTYKYVSEGHIEDYDSLRRLTFDQKQSQFKFLGQLNYRTYQIDTKLKTDFVSAYLSEVELGLITEEEAKCFARKFGAGSIYIHIQLNTGIDHVLSELAKPNGIAVTNNEHLMIKPAPLARFRGNELPDFIIDNRTSCPARDVAEFLTTSVDFSYTKPIRPSLSPYKLTANSLEYQQTLFFLFQNTDNEYVPPLYTEIQDAEYDMSFKSKYEKIDCTENNEAEFNLIAKKYYSTEFSFIVIEDQPPTYEDTIDNMYDVQTSELSESDKI